jgi:hypothetical protein
MGNGTHPNLKGVFGHVTVYDIRHEPLQCRPSRNDPRSMRYAHGSLIIINLAGPTVTGKLAVELQILNDAKEAAIAP